MTRGAATPPEVGARAKLPKHHDKKEELMDTIIGLSLVWWGRRAFDTPTRLPRWDHWLAQLWKPGGVIIALTFLGKGAAINWLDSFFLDVVLALAVVVGWQLRAYRPALWLAVGFAPFAAYSLLEELLRLVGFDVENQFATGGNFQGLASLWLGVFLLIVRSQRKSLTTEQAQRQQSAQAQQAIESQNQSLEYEVHQRTADLARQTDALRTTLQELQATQDQLIQREKMASLGELTAGIAHEIQNPLNFVNNFADVSAELVAELEEERARPQRDAGLEAELLADLRQNLQRISQHGGRASGIVRGMLAHSRQGSGERQPVDVNALCDEYLRLAYHGLRAKDKTFNATLDTDFAPDLPKVAAVPGDLGRVLLNLLTNAFYAVQQRQRQGEPGYRPTVGVATKQAGQWVEICVRDNGTGMPAEVQAKIFQPFFTTKPSGEGTGLGLSLSYDIITQGHSGTLGVASQVGQGTTFTLQLPR